MVGVSGSFGAIRPRPAPLQELGGLASGGLDALYASDLVAEVRTLAWLVNSSCDLACTHCYYQVANGYRQSELLSEDEHRKLLHEAAAAGISRIGLIGKEPLLPGAAGADRTLSLLRSIADLETQDGPLKTSLVTHGMRLGEVTDELASAGLHELHVSFDGAASVDHERIRGPKTFGRAIEGLMVALERAAAERVVASFTLHTHNLAGLAEMFGWAERYGVQHFTLSPYMPQAGGPARLESRSLKQMLTETLPNAAKRLATTRALSLTIDIDADVLYADARDYARVFASSVLLDVSGLPFLQTQIGPVEVTLRIHLPAPLGGLGAISHDGYYFDRHPIYWLQKDYRRRASANLRERSLVEAVTTHRQRNRDLRPLAHGLLHSDHALHRRPEGTPATSLAELP